MIYTKYIKNERIFNFVMVEKGISYSIPLTEKNRHYAEYLFWLSATQEERDAAGVVFAPDEVLE